MDAASLERLLMQNDKDESCLDDLVHDAADALASNINNEGLQSQLEFLMETCGWTSSSILKELGATYTKWNGYTFE